MQSKSVYGSPPGEHNTAENTGDKENKSERNDREENENSFVFEVASLLLLQKESAIPATFCSLESKDSDIENEHHLSSEPNSCGRTARNNQYRILEHSLPRPANTSVGTLKNSEKKNDISISEDNSTAQSPDSTILSLKKGQRLKDGMILMLTGQVDRRKHLLLGAQVFYFIHSFLIFITTR
jgi:hypothetical protein